MFVVLVLLIASVTWIFNYRLLLSGQHAESFEDYLWYHIDFHVYQLGAEAMVRGENIYTQDYAVADIMLPFTYPPLAAMVFSVFTFLPTNLGAAFLSVINIILLWHCLTMILRATTTAPSRSQGAPITDGVGSSLSQRSAGIPLQLIALVATVVLMWCEPVRSTMGYGQINIVLMWLVLMDTVGPQRRLLPQGVLVGLAAAIKLTPAVFGLYFLVRRQWGKAATAAASGVGFTGLAWLLSPENSKQYWFETLHTPSRIGGLSAESNQSLLGWLYRNAVLSAQAQGSEPEEPSRLVWLVGVVAFLGLATWAMVVLEREGHYVAMVFANASVALVCSPISWSHHWVWFAPLLTYLTVKAWQCARSGRPIACVLAGVVLASAPLIFTGAHWLGSQLLWFREVYVLYALAMLSAVAAWRLWPSTWLSPNNSLNDAKSARVVMWGLSALGFAWFVAWLLLKV